MIRSIIIEILKHLPGQHDQLRHGKSSSEAYTRAEANVILGDAKNILQMSKDAKEFYGIYFHPSGGYFRSGIDKIRSALDIHGRLGVGILPKHSLDKLTDVIKENVGGAPRITGYLDQKSDYLGYKSRNSMLADMLRLGIIKKGDVPVVSDGNIRPTEKELRFIEQLAAGYDSDDYEFKQAFKTTINKLAVKLGIGNYTYDLRTRGTPAPSIPLILYAFNNGLLDPSKIEEIRAPVTDKLSLPFITTESLAARRVPSEELRKTVKDVTGSRFTPREKELMQAYIEGRSSHADLADALSLTADHGVVSTGTIKTFVNRILSKSSTRSKPAALVHMMRNGLIDDIPVPDTVREVDLTEEQRLVSLMIAEGRSRKESAEILHLKTKDITGIEQDALHTWELDNPGQLVYFSLRKGYYRLSDVEALPSKIKTSTIADDGKRYSPREKEIVIELAEYRHEDDEDLGDAMGRSTRSDNVSVVRLSDYTGTDIVHMHNLREKTGKSTKFDIVKYAVDNRVVDTNDILNGEEPDINAIDADTWIRLQDIWNGGSVAASDRENEIALNKAANAWDTTKVKALVYAKSTGLID